LTKVDKDKKTRNMAIGTNDSKYRGKGASDMAINKRLKRRNDEKKNNTLSLARRPKRKENIKTSPTHPFHFKIPLSKKLIHPTPK
jgi:hypothetical protein